MEGEHLYTEVEGKKVYGTENKITKEEKEQLKKRDREYLQAHSLWLSGKGPNPDEKTDRKDNVIEFPKREDQEKKVA
jgi:hypothetical protein